jgi:hypothetical protein
MGIKQLFGYQKCRGQLTVLEPIWWAKKAFTIFYPLFRLRPDILQMLAQRYHVTAAE